MLSVRPALTANAGVSDWYAAPWFIDVVCGRNFFSVFTTVTNIDTFHRSVAARAGIAGKSIVVIYSFHHFRRMQRTGFRYSVSVRKINMPCDSQSNKSLMKSTKLQNNA